jgi:DNA-binding helix-hairpin-helix protein with protein kinase domain
VNPPTVIEIGALGSLGALIGEGGQAKVYRAPGITLPDVRGPLVFKRYRSGQSPPHGLHTVVAKRLRMDARAMRSLDLRAAWPVRVVEDRGAVCGVLMPLIPDDYFRQRLLPSGESDRSLQEIQHLLIDPARAARLGMPAPTQWERIILCRDFAGAIHLLHLHGLVIGDVNPKNAVFRLTARPTVMLVDCDAVRIRGNAAVVAQLDFPDWSPPDRQPSQASDVYKFGLFVLRSLAPGTQASVARDPRRLDHVLGGAGRRLLRQSLHPDPAARPNALQWARYFESLLTGRHGVPAATTPRTNSWVPVT